MKKKKKNSPHLLFWYGFGFLAFFGGHEVLARSLPVFLNRGASGGLGLNNNTVAIVAGGTLGIIMLALIRQQTVGLYLLFVGGVVNLLDRLRFGGVRDYWHVLFWTNNLLDLVLFFGLVAFMFSHAHDAK